MLGEEKLSLINKLTRRPMKKEDVYVFDFILCDNDVDRDNESFSYKSLCEIAEKFVGITGIFDHTAKTTNQNARIFSAKVVKDEKRKTRYGEELCFVKASAYMVRTEKNSDLIKEIDAGIKKEVSIGCSVKKKICSVCKNEKCTHKKGKVYGKDKCFTILDGISDAYEWSFVAVPAQVNAGVVKNFGYKKGDDSVDILKDFNGENDVTLTAKQCLEISDRFKCLECLADIGKQQQKRLREDIMKDFLISKNDVDKNIFKSIIEKLGYDELVQIKKFIKFKGLNKSGSIPQLYDKRDGCVALTENDNFKI